MNKTDEQLVNIYTESKKQAIAAHRQSEFSDSIRHLTLAIDAAIELEKRHNPKPSQRQGDYDFWWMQFYSNLGDLYRLKLNEITYLFKKNTTSNFKINDLTNMEISYRRKYDFFDLDAEDKIFNSSITSKTKLAILLWLYYLPESNNSNPSYNTKEDLKEQIIATHTVFKKSSDKMSQLGMQLNTSYYEAERSFAGFMGDSTNESDISKEDLINIHSKIANPCFPTFTQPKKSSYLFSRLFGRK